MRPIARFRVVGVPVGTKKLIELATIPGILRLLGPIGNDTPSPPLFTFRPLVTNVWEVCKD